MDEDVTRDKHRLRVAARTARGRRTGADALATGSTLATAVTMLPEVGAATTMSAYVSTGREPSTGELLARLRERGLRVLLPVVLPDLDLDWALDDGSRRTGAGPGVPEPPGARLGPDAIADADVIVVPALLVDRAGRRLGQGGGSFDRALGRARPDALVVALVHCDELVDGPLPVHPHDRRVDLAVTPADTVRLTRRAGASARAQRPCASPAR